MGRVLKAEFLKLKGSSVLWISAIAVMAAPLLNSLVLSQARTVLWEGYMNQSAAFVAMLLGAMLFGLVTSYVFGREYAEDTLKTLLTTPVRRSAVILAKMAVLLVWSLFLVLVAWGASIPLGAMVVTEGFNWQAVTGALPVFVIMGVLVYATLPLLAWITLLGRGYIPTIGFAVVAAFAGLLAVASDKYGGWFPWAIPTKFVISFRLPEATLEAHSWIVMGALFLLGLALCLWQMRRADID